MTKQDLQNLKIGDTLYAYNQRKKLKAITVEHIETADMGASVVVKINNPDNMQSLLASTYPLHKLHTSKANARWSIVKQFIPNACFTMFGVWVIESLVGIFIWPHLLTAFAVSALITGYRDVTY